MFLCVHCHLLLRFYLVKKIATSLSLYELVLLRRRPLPVSLIKGSGPLRPFLGIFLLGGGGMSAFIFIYMRAFGCLVFLFLLRNFLSYFCCITLLPSSCLQNYRTSAFTMHWCTWLYFQWPPSWYSNHATTVPISTTSKVRQISSLCGLRKVRTLDLSSPLFFLSQGRSLELGGILPILSHYPGQGSSGGIGLGEKNAVNSFTLPRAILSFIYAFALVLTSFQNSHRGILFHMLLLI